MDLKSPLKVLSWKKLCFYHLGILRGVSFGFGRFILHPLCRFYKHGTGRLDIGQRLIFAYPNIENRARVFNHKGELHISANASLKIEGVVEFCPGISLILGEGASLSIGDNTSFAGDSSFTITQHSKIGKNCRFAWGINFLDSDLHEIRDAKGELKNPAKAIFIGNEVWVGCGVTILKGVELGDRCIVAAGSVVTKSFPEGSIVAGVPAEKIGVNEGQWSEGMKFES